MIIWFIKCVKNAAHYREPKVTSSNCLFCPTNWQQQKMLNLHKAEKKAAKHIWKAGIGTYFFARNLWLQVCQEYAVTVLDNPKRTECRLLLRSVAARHLRVPRGVFPYLETLVLAHFLSFHSWMRKQKQEPSTFEQWIMEFNDLHIWVYLPKHWLLKMKRRSLEFFNII